jgi:NAD(P)-dependent dehydrogenase (short-subunit alcohol dehydrogenase family)
VRRLFVERGATVVLSDLDRAALEATAERLGTRHGVRDASDEASVRMVVRAMLNEGIMPAGLPHSAGITLPLAGPEDITAADFSRVVSVDLLSAPVMTSGLPPDCRRRPVRPHSA